MSALRNRSLFSLVAAQADRARAHAIEAEQRLVEAHDAYEVARAEAEAARAELARWAELGDQAAALPLEDEVTDMLADVRAFKARMRASKEAA